MKTDWIVKEDVIRVADNIKMSITDAEIDKILDSYDDWRTQYPEDNWTEIVEQMLYQL
jgi:hypothetical protein